MSKYSLNHEDAYKKLLNSETYRILMESNSGLFLETDSYLNNVLDIEFEKDKEALYDYISSNWLSFFLKPCFFLFDEISKL